MKNKISIIVLLIAITLPQVVSAAWWNPFSWFSNWSFFREPKTEILEKRIEDLEKKLNDKTATTTKENPSNAPEPTVKPKVSPIPNTTQVKNVSPDTSAGENYSTAVAGIYNNINSSISRQLELLTTMSTDIDRYIAGVPRTVNEIKNAVEIIATNENDFKNFSQAIDSDSRLYVADFVKQKTDIDNYVNSLLKYQNEIDSQIVIIRSGYIPQSEMSYYANQFSTITKNVSSTVDSFSKSYNALTDDYITYKTGLVNQLQGIGDAMSKNTYNYQSIQTYVPTPIHCVSFGNGRVTTIDCN